MHKNLIMPCFSLHGVRRDELRHTDVDLAAVALAPVLVVDTNYHRT